MPQNDATTDSILAEENAADAKYAASREGKEEAARQKDIADTKASNAAKFKSNPNWLDDSMKAAAAKGERGGSSAVPKRHNGGPVLKDGAYALKAGEHVLTAKEAEKARKHALMASGLKSLAKPAPKTAGEPAAKKMGGKKTTTGITIRDEKNQAAKIADKTKK